MVHNLRMLAWDKLQEPAYGFDWALELNEKFKQKITDGDHHAMIHYETISKDTRLAIPTPEHYLPLLYILGLKGATDDVSFFNDRAVAGSLTMTSVKLATSL